MSFLVWEYTSQDFVQTQQNFARSHDRVTVTFRNSEFALLRRLRTPGRSYDELSSPTPFSFPSILRGNNFFIFLLLQAAQSCNVCQSYTRDV